MALRRCHKLFIFFLPCSRFGKVDHASRSPLRGVFGPQVYGVLVLARRYSSGTPVDQWTQLSRRYSTLRFIQFQSSTYLTPVDSSSRFSRQSTRAFHLLCRV
jgi:hypothetical protein